MKRYLIAASALVLVPVLAACGGGSDSGSSGTLPASDVQIVAVDGIAWNAASYTATAADGTVAILGRNESSLPHNLHLIDSSGTQVREFIDLPSKGDAEVVDFALAPGDYTVVCLVPGHSNMKATLTVK
jgi:plastocyanin